MSLYVQGDLHASPTSVKNCLMQIKNPSAEDVIIVCGDAGLEYGNSIQTKTKKQMSKFAGTWVVMRGNHDNRYWRDHKDDSAWDITSDGKYLYEKKYSNILYVPDEGGLIEIDGYNFLFIPGAYSIDKEYRLRFNWPYEREEQLTQKELDNLIDIATNNKIDFIIAHTYPLDIEHFLEYLFLDFVSNQSAVDKNMEYNITKIVEAAKDLKHYFFGHMHDDRGNIKGKYTLLYNVVVCIDDYIKD